MKGTLLLTLSLLFLALGVFLLVIDAVVAGVLGALLGLIGTIGFVLERAQHRGDPDAGGPHGPGRGRYLLLAIASAGLGAAIGLVFLISTPTLDRRFPRTPLEAQIFGAIVLAICLFGVFVGLRRWLRFRQSTPH